MSYQPKEDRSFDTVYIRDAIKMAGNPIEGLPAVAGATGPISRAELDAEKAAADGIATKAFVTAAVGALASEPVNVQGFVGNRTVAQINALVPAAGDSVVATDAGTPTAGASDAAVAGDLLEYDGTQWQKLVSAVGGFPPDGTRALIGAGTLFGPLTDVTDRHKVAEWDGTSLTPTVSAIADGVAIVVKGEGSVRENRVYVRDTSGGWVQAGGAGMAEYVHTDGTGAVAVTDGGAGNASKVFKLDGNGKAEGRDLQVDGAKLDGVEALADVTDQTNVNTALGTADAAAVTDTGVGAGNANKVLKTDGAGKLDGRDVGADGTKLDGVEALADVTDQANVNTALGTADAAAVTDTGVGAGNANKVLKTDGAGKLDGRDVGADGTKLDGVEALADVTDQTNVNAALGTADAAAVTDTGVGAGNANKVLKTDGAGKLDGRDVGADGTKLDGVEALADVTDLANVSAALGTTAAAAVNSSAGAGDAGKLPKLDGNGLLAANMLPGLQVITADITIPPTDAELDTAFGGQASAFPGRRALVEDTTAPDTNVYFVASNGTSWWYVALTKAA